MATDRERPAAELLRFLMEGLYLSNACAARDHMRCPQVDTYTGLPCCCPECDHTDLDGSPPSVCLPLLHLAEEGRRQPEYTYAEDQPLGVRTDMVTALARVLVHHVPAYRRPAVAYQLAVAASLVFAPRSGA